MSLQIHAGRYYYADDRPQPQRLVGVISLGNRELESRTVRVFLNPGESVSVHCYSRHNFRDKQLKQGIYIRELRVRGPVFESWPPATYRQIFGNLEVTAEPRESSKVQNGEEVAGEGGSPTNLVQVNADSPEELKSLLRAFASRAFSSSPSDDEMDLYHEVALNELTKTGSFVGAARLGLKAILCSPRFLMPAEGQTNPSYRRAAALSRILWLSVPDEELLSLAAQERLHGEILLGQIHRMLDDDRGKRLVHSLADQWLNLRELNKVTPSLKLYPLYDDLLNHNLPIETRTYLRHLIRENLPISFLVDSDFSFLNQRLARHYGIEGVIGQEMRLVRFPPESPRGGLLTMGSVLKITTDGFDTSPILRGAWISRNIAGTPLSPPPESVSALEPEHGDEAATLREQIELHKNNAICRACHKSIDPYGFALESFDATGQWRERYRIKQPHRSTFVYRPQGYFKTGEPVDTSGEIHGQRFDDIFALKRILLEKERFIAYHFAKVFFEYANGYEPNLAQRLHLWTYLGEDPKNSRMKDLITEVLLYSLSPERR